MTKKKVVLCLSVLLMLFVVTLTFSSVYAQTPPSYIPQFLFNQYTNGASGINTIIRNVIEFLFAIAGLIVLVFIIWAGFKFITSGGDSGKKEEAQKQIVAAVIGLLIVVFSFFIVQLIFTLLGLGSVQDIQLPCGVNQTTNCLGAPTPS